MNERIYQLKERTELRVDVDAEQELNIILRKGKAEIFGMELKIGELFSVNNKRLAIFSKDGCTLALEGQSNDLTESESHSMEHCSNLHSLLEVQRQDAKRTDRFGPRVIIIGNADSGKSTTCRILANYGVRDGWHPMFVDLDLGQGSLSPPGSIVATQVKRPISIEEEYPLEAPLVYFHGHKNPAPNPRLYKLMIENMATSLERINFNDRKSDVHSGWIINTMGWTTGLGYELLLHSIGTLRADHVIVIGDPDLSDALSHELRYFDSRPQIRCIPASSGVRLRSRSFRTYARYQRIQHYFYGINQGLRVYTHVASIQTIKLFKIGPLSSEDMTQWLEICQVRIDQSIVNQLIAISHAKNFDELPYTTIAGYIRVISIDIGQTNQGSITYLAPCPNPIHESKLLLIGTIDIPDVEMIEY